MPPSDPPPNENSSLLPDEAQRPSLPSTAVSLDPKAPESILGTLLGGRYRLDEVLGTGGTSVVYRALHVHMRKAFAVKVLHREFSAHPEIVARFEREAVAAASIDHPNVAGATDFGRLGDGSFYLVLEHVAGRSLGEVLTRREPLEATRVIHILRQMADALSAAHAIGIIHRDLKPENVMLIERPDDSDFVKVLDFGIAKVDSSATEAALTQIGSVFGTPQYMSPEQASGAPADPRSDLYALGVLGYEMLVGYPPFDDRDVGEVLRAHLHKPAPLLPASVIPELRSLVEHLLQKAPDDRFQSATQVVETLDLLARQRHASGETAIAATRVSSKSKVVLRWRSIELTAVQLTIGGGALGALLILGMIALASSGPSSSAEGASVLPGDEPGGVVPAPLGSAIPKLPRNVILARAAVGDDDALRTLSVKAEQDSNAEAWLALGRGYSRREQYTKAMQAYEKALGLRSTYQDDEVLRRDVWSAAREEESAEPALRIASRYLGAAGADILYDVWVGTARKTPTTQLARQLVYDSTVRSKASPALDVALKLRAARRCQDFEHLLSDVILHGDQRVVRLLRPLEQMGGCGPGKREDCYPCLRDDAELLQAALTEASRRPRPPLGF